MTDEQIIKALDCCHSELGNMCSICPLFDPDNDYCEDELHKNALNLINRQKAELERLKKNIDGRNIFTTNHMKVIWVQAMKEFAEELEYFVLNEDIEVVEPKCKDYESYINGANQFRHQIKNGINNIVKEMTEEK